MRNRLWKNPVWARELSRHRVSRLRNVGDWLLQRALLGTGMYAAVAAAPAFEKWSHHRYSFLVAAGAWTWVLSSPPTYTASSLGH